MQDAIYYMVQKDYLCIDDIYELSQLNSQFSKYVNKDDLWKLLFERHYRDFKYKLDTYKATYKMCCELSKICFGKTLNELYESDNNNLIAIPSELGKLTKLLMLNLCYNKLTTIPGELGNLVGLTMYQ